MSKKNVDYFLPFIISLLLHLFVFFSGYFLPTLIDPAISLEIAPSALEICFAGAQEEIVTQTSQEVFLQEEFFEEIFTDDVNEEMFFFDKINTEESSELVEKKEAEKEHEVESNALVKGNADFFQDPIIGVENRHALLPISNPSPVYPRSSRKKGEEGFVVLEIKILATGSVATVVVSVSSGFERLDKAAVDAVLKWQFRAATVNGVPVDIVKKIPIIFQLRNK